MRRFIGAVTIVLLGIAFSAVSVTVALATVAPFEAGNAFFPMQSFAEQQIGQIWPGDLQRASWYLDLAFRRMEDLAHQTGRPQETAALNHFDLALDQVVQALTGLPLAGSEDLRLRFLGFAQQSQDVLEDLIAQSRQNSDRAAVIQARLLALQQIVAALDDSSAALRAIQWDDLAKMAAELPVAAAENAVGTAIDPLGVPFPAGSLAHEFYPLVGAHAVIGCESCHPGEVYAGAASLCADCHQEALPDSHFTGDCAACHTPVSWAEATFDHALAGSRDCASCHADRKPANHFDGQCSACHNTSSWEDASFNHAGQTDCKSCHTDKAPKNHFSGQCSDCHSTSSWKFEHANGLDCVACHADDRPKEHASGQCSNCHNTKNWDDAEGDGGGDGEGDGQSLLPLFPANHPAGQTGQNGRAESSAVLFSCQVCHVFNSANQ